MIGELVATLAGSVWAQTALRYGVTSSGHERPMNWLRCRMAWPSPRC